jgi:hypothetical protein
MSKRPSDRSTAFAPSGVFSHVLAAAVTSLLALAAGCGDGGGPVKDVVTYLGAASDEMYANIVDVGASASPDATNSAVFDEPADGDTVSAAEPATFSWHLPAMDDMPFSGGCDASQRRTSGLTLEHCPLGDGYLYWIQAFDDAGNRLANVLSTEKTWTPDATDWAAITAKPGVVDVKLITVFVTSNTITLGPFLTELSLEVQ